MNNKFVKSLYVIVPILTIAILGSIFVNMGMEWFNSLTKPTQWIPNIVIPIVWTIIYLTFAIILIIWQNNNNIPIKTVILLAVNGILNVFWCLLFFTLNLTHVGNIAIITNLIAGFWLFIDIYRYKDLCGYATLIYPIWLSIATTLNMAMWILN